ncbi:MAG: choice-of-anchor J domain-containing protein [Flavobacteriaceae bacterium]|nr:choice-of-anchor J domain-containing protein [Flavobacteriaceae bacterium]
MKKLFTYLMLVFLPVFGFSHILEEGFDDINTLATSGWMISNQSNPIGTSSWFQGNSEVFTSHIRNASSYIGVNYNSIAGAGTISNWLITPTVNVKDGDKIIFWTPIQTITQWNDRLEVRASSGTLTLPLGNNGIESFYQTLLIINDNYNFSYPTDWARYEIVLSGIGTTPQARNFAFRYNVANGGPLGTNSNYIGIDTFSILEGNAPDPIFFPELQGNIGDPSNDGVENTANDVITADCECVGTLIEESYCIPQLNCTDGDLITWVSFGDINNPTDCSPNGYGDYTHMSTTVENGNTYPIAVSVGGGWQYESVSVWIDYNQNFEFEESEFTFIGAGSNSTINGNIHIPPTIPTGEYRMRVRVAATVATADKACDTRDSYGETEDYTIYVTSVSFDCSAISAHIGDACDDGDDTTENDVITADCECVGTLIEESYCIPQLNCTDGDLITWVSFGDINNPTDCSPNGYGDYTHMSTTVENGNTYPIAVSVGGGWQYESVSVWIDYNQNFEFEESEFTFIGAGSNSTINGNIHIPPTIPTGEYRMRVRVAATITYLATADKACDTLYSYGETEDYTIYVTTVSFDCSAISANIGDACDDGDDTTENDVVTADCGCAGTPIPPMDMDNDGIKDDIDNCPNVYNPNQEDMDGDGIGDACEDDIDGDGVLNEDDCDPYDASITTGSTWYADADGDGYGDAAVWIVACTQPQGFVANNLDCNDADATIHPNAYDISGDGIDQDCDGIDAQICNDPVNLAVNNITSNSATATWTAADDQESWYFYLFDEDNIIQDRTVYDTNILIENLMSETTYRLVIQGICSYDISDFVEIYFTTLSDVETADTDGDGVADDVDSCPDTYNPDQADWDGDGIGDACDTCDAPTGVMVTRLSGTTASFTADDTTARYQGSANRAGRPLRAYPMYGMEDIRTGHIQQALVPSFDYDIWFRTSCPGETFSEWIGPFYLPMYNAAAARTEIALTPNPTYGVVQIAKVESKTIEVYDMNGAKLMEINTANNQFDISELPTGKYNLRIIDTDGNTHFEQVIKK